MRLIFILWASVVFFATAPVLGQEVPGELSSKTLFDGKIAILLPAAFEPLDSSILVYKYPNENRPKVVYSNMQLTVNVAFSVRAGNKVTKENMGFFTEILAQTLLTAMPKAKILDKGTLTQNGNSFGFIELKNKAANGEELYNLMYFTVENEELIMVSFNCPYKISKVWKKQAKEIMDSIKVKA